MKLMSKFICKYVFIHDLCKLSRMKWMMTTDEFALISFSLKLSENELQIIADEQDSNVEDLTKLVKENEGLLDKMKVRQTFDRF